MTLKESIPKHKLFGERLRLARQQAGLSQSKLAQLIGDRVAQTTIARYEAGGSMPKPGRMAKFVEVLGKSEAWLRGLDSGSGGTFVCEKPAELMLDWTESHSRSLHVVGELDSFGDPGPRSVIFLGSENREARTAYLIQWALRLARKQRRVSFFYLDGWAGYFASELVASAFQIEVSEVRQDHVELLEREGLFENLTIFSSADRNFFEYIHSSDIRDSRPHYIFIDGLSNLSRLRVQDNFALPRREEIFSNLGILKNVAVSDGICFVAAEYLRRFGEGEDSSFWSPLIGSNFQIFQDLTDGFYFLGAAVDDTTTLEILKNRDGHLGEVPLNFSRTTRRYAAPLGWYRGADGSTASPLELAPKPTLQEKEQRPKPTTAQEAEQTTDGYWYDDEGIAGFSLWDKADG